MIKKDIHENHFRKLNIIILMTGISKKEIKKFLMQGTFTAKLVTVKMEVHTLFRFGLY
jgi:hypothetical protein